MRMMDGMIFASHNGLDIPIHGIMNISCPNRGKEQETKVCQIVARSKGQGQDVGTGLHHAIERMKGNTCPWCECFGLVVLVMQHVHMLVQPLVGMQRPMHPINANFHQTKVKDHGDSIPMPSSNFLHRMIDPSPSLFDEIFVNNGQCNVNNHTGLCQSNLIPNGFRRGPYAIAIFKGSFGNGMNVNKVMKNGGHTIVDQNASEQIAQITQ